MKKIGIVLSGCGFLDGSEIHEATITLLAIDRLGAQAIVMAPKIAQSDVVDHLQGEPSGEKRDVLRESARIARGKVEDIARAQAGDVDALVFPGGYGAAKNLSTFARDGKGMTVHKDVERLIRELRASAKPMGFICIAPVLAAKVLGNEAPVLTIGTDPGSAAALESMGAKHVLRNVDEIAVDEKLKLVSTPAYMLGPSIAAVAQGIDKLVSKVIDWA